MALDSRHLMPDGLNFAINVINQNRNVVSAEIEEQRHYRAIVNIDRGPFYPPLKAYIADVYLLTASDVNEINRNFPDVNCIVVISNWDHYTDKAKNVARALGIGVFTIFEFREALKHRGNRFLDTGVARETEN